MRDKSLTCAGKNEISLQNQRLMELVKYHVSLG